MSTNFVTLPTTWIFKLAKIARGQAVEQVGNLCLCFHFCSHTRHKDTVFAAFLLATFLLTCSFTCSHAFYNHYACLNGPIHSKLICPCTKPQYCLTYVCVLCSFDWFYVHFFVCPWESSKWGGQQWYMYVLFLPVCGQTRGRGWLVVACKLFPPWWLGISCLAGWAGLHWEREDNTMVHMRYARQTY